MEPKWLTWAKRLQAISQNGLAYTESAYDRERYEEIRSISSAILDHQRHDHPPSAYGIYKIFVLCEMKGGSFQHNTETEDACFFSKDDLPALSARRISRRQIDMCFDFVENDAHEPLFE